MNFTGKASIDKPWLNFYPKDLEIWMYRKLQLNHF